MCVHVCSLAAGVYTGNFTAQHASQHAEPLHVLHTHVPPIDAGGYLLAVKKPLNWFSRVRSLAVGGFLVLEPQPWRSYCAAVTKRHTAGGRTARDLALLQLRPESFVELLQVRCTLFQSGKYGQIVVWMASMYALMREQIKCIHTKALHCLKLTVLRSNGWSRELLKCCWFWGLSGHCPSCALSAPLLVAAHDLTTCWSFVVCIDVYGPPV